MMLLNRAREEAARRRDRRQYLPPEIFGEPAWDILIDLYIASCHDKAVSVSSACIASGVPSTTALRCLTRLEELGLIERMSDRNDRRRVLVRILPHARRAIGDWLRQSQGWTVASE